MKPRDDIGSTVDQPSRALQYRRVLLKLSGEALMGEAPYGIDGEVLDSIARELGDAHRLGIELALVIGAGNIFRGVRGATEGMERASADYMGMVATVINALALQDALERLGVTTRVMSAIEMRQVAEPYIRRRAMRHLEKGRVVIFAAGTGNPSFSTDTAAVLRAIEIGAEAVLKATNVRGVFTADPNLQSDAVFIESISFTEVLSRDLKVMDATAISMCRDHQLPIVVFDIHEPGAVRRILAGETVGTTVRGR